VASGAPLPVARDPLWDNARWVAIALVVVGHSIELPSRNDVAFGVYLTIYAVHMPLFAFMSGRFSRAEPLTVRAGADMLRRLVAPLVVFQLVYALLAWHYNGAFVYDLARPIWHLWFIPALVLWRLTLPLVAALRWPFTASLVVACAAGLWPSIEAIPFAGHTFALLPFFVAGWACREGAPLRRLLAARQRPAVRLAAAAVVVVVAGLAVVFADEGRDHRLRPLVQGRRAYASLGYHGTQWCLLRLAVVLVGLVLIGCLLLVVSRREQLVTAWGRRTMTVYLIHLLPIIVAEQQGWISRDRDATTTVLALAVVAVAWTAVLSTRVVDRLTAPLVHPELRWLLAARLDDTARRMVADQPGRPG
jgi:fucose 4-O-acetylase-like acetyltransferase